MSLGTSKDEVRRTLGLGKEFMKVPGFPASLAFVDIGLHVHFDDADRVVEIEAGDVAQVGYRGVTLLHRPVADVLAELSAAGVHLRRDQDGAELPEIGIGLYAPIGQVEGVIVFRPRAIDSDIEG